jgi:hypothetical protein
MEAIYYGGGFILSIVVIAVLIYSFRNRNRGNRGGGTRR